MYLKTFVLGLGILSIMACSKNTNITQNQNKQNIDISNYEVFGDSFSTNGLLTKEEMLKKYQAMEVGDSLNVVFQSEVKSVCQKKGCWMKLDLGDAESFVRFKDYSFFVPMDGTGTQAIVKGTAYKEETSIAALKHYAQDAGKSKEEIDAITKPKVEYTFKADGVLMKKK